jgi:hypothetical protein
MSEVVYRICALLQQVLQTVPVGTNLGLFHLLLALVSGRLLHSRGAVFPALAEMGLPDEAVRRVHAALTYGRWKTAELVLDWHLLVLSEGRWQPHCYEGYRPVACDLVGFFRPRLVGCVQKHYQSQADKALPAVVLGMIGPVGSVANASRLALPRALVRAEIGDSSEKDLERRTLRQAGHGLKPNEVLAADAGFSLQDMLASPVARYVLRRDKNFTARRNFLPAYKGHGRHPEYGEVVRPLARGYKDRWLEATPPDATARWRVGQRAVRALIFENLVDKEAKPGSACFRCVVIVDPKYKDPMVLVTNLPLTAYAIWRLYRDRWAIEQLPLSAKQMLGAERAFVFGHESRVRLPELALLAGNLLSYVAATSPAMATGFWDRCARPTCGRLRRVLSRLDFSKLALPGRELRKKESPTAHLPKGVAAHRRQKAKQSLSELPAAA